ncbi:MAG: agmatinase [Tissierellia bacterium]|nr:agmatinase [Tissierellia bacterium]
MKFTEDMIRSKELWAGLHDPNRRIEDADIVVFGIPYDGAASFRSGAKDGPRAIRDITFSITPTTEDFEYFGDLKVLDLGDFYGDNQEDLFKKVEKQVQELVEKKKFFMMIGGDHSVNIPITRGIDKGIDEDFGLIHIDAHFDLCHSLGGNTLSHGCPARRASELERLGGSDHIFFLGIRSVEEDELEFMKNNPVNVINARELSEIGAKEAAKRVVKHFKDRGKEKIYITFDIDALDPGFAGGTGTPQFGGITPRDALTLLRVFSKELNIIGFDIVEVAPNLDPSLTSSFAARKLITEMWGFYYHKYMK